MEVRRAVQHRTDRQIRLDRETGSPCLAVRAALKTLEASYTRLDFYRTVTLAACPVIPTLLCPEALAAFRSASQIEHWVQQSVKTFWGLQQTRWRVGRGTRAPFPEFSFKLASGTESDLLVSWKSEFERKSNSPLQFGIQERGLRSTAELRREHDEWTVAWIQ